MKKNIVPPLHSCIGKVFDRNQNVQFYIIWKNIKLKKLSKHFFEDDNLYGIKSNISEPIFHNSEYDNVISLFVGNKSFILPTGNELLSRASIQILEIKSGRIPHFSVGSPTYIQVAVREK